jgi:hypothetical protein
MIVRLFAAASPLLLVVACGPAPGYETTAAVQTTPGGVDYVEQPAQVATAAPLETEVTVEVFYEELAPYGSFYEMEPYGTVWTANDSSYVPYQKGYWVYTEYGFTWVAETEWGWATEHYGRWVWVDDQWVWIPDDQWGPAWVEWRDAETMVGWAPLGPDGWHTIPPAEHWVFVDVTYVFYQDVYDYYAPPTLVSSLWGASARVSWTTAPGGWGYCPGPSPRSLRDRRVTVRQRGLNRVYVGRSRPARGGRSARPRPTVRVSGGDRPSVAVRGGDRPSVRVDGPDRPTVRVDGPGRPTVIRTPTPRPADDALTRDARRRWTRSPPPSGSRHPRTRVIGARVPDAPQWEAGAYGREASDAEVRAAVERARRHEAARRSGRAATPLPARPSGPTPGVTVVRRPPAPAATPAPEVSRRPTPPPVSPGVATATPRTPSVAPPMARPSRPPPSAGPIAPVARPRPSAPAVRPARPPTPHRPSARPSFGSAFGSRPPAARPSSPSVARPAPRAPAARHTAPVARPSASRAPTVHRTSPSVRRPSTSSSSHQRQIQRPVTRHANPSQRRAAPSLGSPGVGRAVRRH